MPSFWHRYVIEITYLEGKIIKYRSEYKGIEHTMFIIFQIMKAIIIDMPILSKMTDAI